MNLFNDVQYFFLGMQWHLGKENSDCFSTCMRYGLVCSNEQLQKYNAYVDTSEQIIELIKHLGGTTSAKFCSDQQQSAGFVPAYNNNSCFQSQQERDLSTFDCGEVPKPANKNIKRICWCHNGKKL